MKPTSALLAIALAAGCGPPPEAEQPPPDGPAIDFAGWPAATARPYRVEIPVTALCIAPTPEEQRDMEAARVQRHGPHYRPSIVVRVSPAALDAFRAGRPLPVGAVVVKEKHPDEAAAGPPTEYAAMVKREPGYDPANGDWEYLFEATGPPRHVTRGRLAECVDCHRRAGGTDYLFRPYLKAHRSGG